MNPIRLSKDWVVLVHLARERKFKSTDMGPLARFVDEVIEAPDAKKAVIFEELVKFLAEEERLKGTARIYFPPPAIGDSTCLN